MALSEQLRTNSLSMMSGTASMVGKLMEHPEPIDRVLRCKMQNVKFPEGETELAVS
jgi:hypothetical protein